MEVRDVLNAKKIMQKKAKKETVMVFVKLAYCVTRRLFRLLTMTKILLNNRDMVHGTISTQNSCWEDV